jgi:hypothetical protein
LAGLVVGRKKRRWFGSETYHVEYKCPEATWFFPDLESKGRNLGLYDDEV